MKKTRALLTTICLLGGCQFGPGKGGPAGDDAARTVELTYDFDDGLQDWETGFADYTADVADGIGFVSGIEDLPAELDEDGQGLLVSGNNAADDLFMFLKRTLDASDGIRPDTTYEVSYTITFASNAPSDCFGIGGAPGEAVTLKAGATSEEPEVVEADGAFALNVDKGNQMAGGPAASVISDIANGTPCETVPDLTEAPYVTLTKTHTHDTPVNSGAEGVVWLLIGTDSGFEGRTAVYYQRIEVTLTPADGG